MKRPLLIALLLLINVALSFGQSDINLNRATSYAVLGSTKVVNTGATGIIGDLGISPGETLDDSGTLNVTGAKAVGNNAAANAQKDALAVYDALSLRGAKAFGNVLGGNVAISPGVYKINGNAQLESSLALDGKGDVNAVFIFIIDGNLLSNPTTGIFTENGAQPQNIYWLVTGNVLFENTTVFLGNILAKGDITMEPGASLTGRAISFEGAVNLNSNTVILPELPRTNLRVQKEAEKSEYEIGDEATYTITASNAGPATAINVVVEELLPEEGLEFVSASSDNGTYDPVTNKWNVGNIASKEAMSLTLIFKVTKVGTIVNGVRVASYNPDPDPSDNNDDVPITVTPPKANVSVYKEAEKAEYKVGDEVTYTITASNAGPNSATGVIVQENIPDGLAFISAATAKGTYSEETSQWNVDNLAQNESATLTLVFRITKAGTLVNGVDIISDNSDPAPDDNQDKEPIDVSCQPLNVTLSGESTICDITGNLIYTVTKVPEASYNFTLPDGWVRVSQNENNIEVKPSEASGSISVTVKDQCDQTVVKTLDVEVITTPEKPTISGTDLICAVNTDNVYTASGVSGGNVTYEWHTTGDLQIVSDNGTETVVVRATGADGGTLTVKAQNACGVSGEIAAKTIVVSDLPATPGAIQGNTDICAGEEVTYSVEAVASASSYTWTVPADWDVAAEDLITSVPELTVTPKSTGTISVSQSNDCGSNSESSLNVTVTQVPLTPDEIYGDQVCVGEKSTFFIDPVEGTTEYIWNVTGDLIIIGDNTSSSIEVQMNGAGAVSVAAVNQCSTGEPATREVAPITKPVITGIEGPAEICKNSEGNVFSVPEISGAISYNWILPEGWNITDGEGTNAITVTGTDEGGTVSVTVSNTCFTSEPASLEVSIAVPPAAVTRIYDSSSLCEGLVYSAETVQGASSYTWSVPAGFTITSGQGTATIKVQRDDANASGSVTVVANNIVGCAGPATSASMNIEVINGDLNFPKAFSPNGDRKNDTWEIKNLEKYAANEIVVFNRWGSEVYKTKNYQNNWNGGNLEKGTYFYKAKVSVCEGVVKEYTGYVTIFH
ncbi:ice-binding family protein [Pontibacter silvestris]|uniref:Ice-binding family protein n=1 Tax=Pontibacter silvestris TaxID=2305183 RepID=A0ABW4X1A7_9BACT|nr:ice-binding family protein [Pontibacter silvestris]MCC9135909.1 DUF11 domain-containing protein [Pontibacter silvestris]